MNAGDFGEMIRTLADGWTKRDYESVAAHFAPEVFYSDSLNYTLTNRLQLLGFFQDDDGRPQSCLFHDQVFDESRQVGTAEYTYEGTFRYHGTVWIELKDDKIESWREYQYRSDEDWKTFWKR
jgi:hypothetical protein